MVSPLTVELRISGQLDGWGKVATEAWAVNVAKAVSAKSARKYTSPMHFKARCVRPGDAPRPGAAALFLLAVVAAASVAFPAIAAGQASLAWKAPAAGDRWTSLSTVNVTVTYQMNGVLKAMLGSRADPRYIIEDRTRTYSGGQAAGQINVDDVFVRHYGGPNPAAGSVTRSRKQIVTYDPSGRWGIEPYLCPNEPALNDKNPNAPTFTACAPPQAQDQVRFQDPGDAALSVLPATPIQAGQTWTFSRKVAVGRELASGTMTYVDTVSRIDSVDNQQIAVIDVAGTGRVDPAADLQAKGFHTGTMSFTGTGQFNMTAGVPAAQHYTGHVEWHASILGANIGLIFDEVYDAKPWTLASRP
jgi:hypothetical protein